MTVICGFNTHFKGNSFIYYEHLQMGLFKKTFHFYIYDVLLNNIYPSLNQKQHLDYKFLLKMLAQNLLSENLTSKSNTMKTKIM